MKRRIWSLLLVLVMVLSTYLTSGSVSLAASMTGAGTAQSPYLIRTAEDLYGMENNPVAHYKLMNDLNLGNVQRAPMAEFGGVLDGGGHTLKNLNIETSESYVGLFSKLNSAVITNLNIDTCKIYALNEFEYVGAIAGYAKDTKFTNIKMNNLDISGYQYVGGICGYAEENSEFQNCGAVKGTIAASYAIAGGISGYLKDAKLFQCYSKLNVSGAQISAGGIVGYVADTVNISQCFSEGEISGSEYIGGLVGYVETNYTSIINDSFAICSLKQEKSSGGLASIANYSKVANSYAVFTADTNRIAGLGIGSFLNSYFDQQTSKVIIPSAQARTTAKMYQESNYVGWDFENIWSIDAGNDYPRLRFENSQPDPIKTLKVVLEPGEEMQLSVDEDLSENANMTWISSDETVVAVDNNGMMKALKKGDAVITVKSKDGKYVMEIKVLVVDSAKEYRLAIDLSVGKSCRLTIDNAEDNTPVTWISNDTSIATVTDKGRVTAVKKGLVLIQVEDENGVEIGQIYVRVR